MMNKHFVNIVKGPSKSMDSIDDIIIKYKDHPSIIKINNNVSTVSKFSFFEVHEHEIENEINSLKTRKSPGYDNIPPKILKDTVGILKSPLCNLFNTALEEGIFPHDLKYANVSPLFKKDDRTNKENYRPISILPCISKIFERIMFQQISFYITSIVSPYLCGFRKGYNTQHALLRLLDKLNRNLDKKHSVGLFFMDLSKAFDSIPHDLTIAKLNAYGFDKQSLKLIYSYFEGRQQRVKINSEYSSWEEILTGVPQGSVLGPLLFNLFINDLFLFVEESEICNYADDNTLSVADFEIDHIIDRLQSDINRLQCWLKNNNLLLNVEKCQLLIMEPPGKSRDLDLSVNISNKMIKETTQAKMLGLTLCKDASMDEYIKHTCKRASSKLNALARLSPYLNEQKRILLMKTFTTSLFNYCPITWMYCLRKSNRLINKIHERALRIAYNDYLSDFQLLLDKDSSITIHQKNVQYLAVEVYKTFHNLNPSFMAEIFKPKQHSHNIRRKNLVIENPRTTKYGLETFRYKANHIWSQIPEYIQMSTDINIFKKYVSENCQKICNCNICKPYITNLGFINSTNCLSSSTS